MPITSRFVVRSAIGLLAVGFLTLLGIVGMTIWLGERAQVYFNDVIEARDTRGSAVELRNAVQTAESSQRGFLVTGNEIYLAPYDTAKAMALRQLDTLEAGARAATRQPRSCFAAGAVITEKIGEMDQTIALKNDLQGCGGAGAVPHQSRQGADGRGQRFPVRHHPAPPTNG